MGVSGMLMRHRLREVEGPMSIVADRVMAARLVAKFTQPQLARRIGVSSQWIQKLEAGEIGNPHIEKLRRLAEATDVSLSFILGENQELELDLTNMRRLDRIAKYIAPEWLGTLEEILKDIARLPPDTQKYVWRQIQFTLKVIKAELDGNGRRPPTLPPTEG